MARSVREGARFISSAAETHKQRLSFRTAGRRVPGGLLVNGTNYFGTGSDGARYGVVPLLLEGYATVSQTISYDDVFVPDGFHYGLRGGAAFYAVDSTVGPVAQLMINSVILGMGFGALEAAVAYVREYTRPADPRLESATEDPIMRWHVGRHSARLAAARALQREYAAELEVFDGDPAERARLSVQMMRCKATILDAVLETAGDLHRLAGGRATSNTYRLDRFWRNARTLSVHDSIDTKLQLIGRYELTGEAPPISWLT